MIRDLPAHLIREIAVGEVLSSPVDVVKELLDNALDAGANRLELELIEGGIKSIILTDNGQGMSLDDLPRAIEQHKTSKLESLSHITTLGFRGEGLYALQHAAKLKLTSRPVAQLGGASLYAHAGQTQFEEHPAPSGTRAEVSELFEHLPTRKQVLDPAPEEFRKISQLLAHYLLHYPHLKLKLMTDGNLRWHYAGGNFREAIKFFWGPVTANRLISLKFSQASLSLEGLISRPELTRPRRDRLLLAVNGRPISWQERWTKAVLSAYGELLPVGHYPVGVLNLQLPTEDVLVSTAPDKTSVRFMHEENVLAFLQDALLATLASHPLAPALPQLEPSESLVSAPRHRFPDLKHLGTYQELYLLAEAEGQLWIVDQHAAHERILFEELEIRYQTEAAFELQHAELIPLSQEEAANFQARQLELASLGIRLEPFGGSQWRLRSVPAFLAGHSHLLAEVIKESLHYETLQQAWRQILGRLACLPAIKAGHALSSAKAQVLLDQLRQCHTPWSCPHGRPTTLVLTELELAKRFKRSHGRTQSSNLKPTASLHSK